MCGKSLCDLGIIMRNQRIQTEEESFIIQTKKHVYNRIEDTKRCELIKILQNGNDSLREASAKLGLNYSTAKTIVQTFRREKRVAKIPKKQYATKKAQKKEKMLRRILTTRNLSKMQTNILNNEMESEKIKQQDLNNIQKKDTSTLPTCCAEVPQLHSKVFPRILSANQIITFAAVEEGPMMNQTSRSTDTPQDLPMPIFKKDIFYIFAENNSEDQYRSNLDYDNSIDLKTKHKTMESVKLPCICPSNDLSKIKYKLYCEPKFKIFDFSAYSEKVQLEAYKLNSKLDTVKALNLTLPLPFMEKNQIRIKLLNNLL